MKNRIPEDTENVVVLYADMLYRLCFSMLGNREDAEDAVSEVVLKYMTAQKLFADEAHKKAWLLRVATHRCYDLLRFRKRSVRLCPEAVEEMGAENEVRDIIEAVYALPPKYKTVVVLHYVEGYKTEEIAKILSVSPVAVRKRLQYAREKLKMEQED